MMTKRQLGMIFMGVGLVGGAGTFVVDLLGAGQFDGVGPAQRLALLGAGLIIFVGLTLLPLGDRPA